VLGYRLWTRGQRGERHDGAEKGCDGARPADCWASRGASWHWTRFVRRLIAERRIEYHKLGRYVRISEPVLAEFIKNGRVPPVTSARRRAA
jgi:excisionase family DNA binding protein